MKVVRSEWTKLRSVRSTWLTAGSVVFAGVALSVLSVSDVLGGSASDLPAGWDPTAISLKGFLFAQLVIGMLGALGITSEYATGSIGISLTAVPSRTRLLAAKGIVVTAIAFLTGLVTTLISFTLVQVILAAAGLPAASPGDPGVIRALLSGTLYLTCMALIGLAVGALTRSATSSLATLVGALLLVPAIAPGLPGALGDFFARYWPNTAGQVAFAVTSTGDTVTPAAGLAILVVATAAIAIAGYTAFRSRDV